MHQAIQPVHLLCNIFGAPYDPQGIRLSLHLQPAEIEAARSAVLRAIQVKNLRAGAGTFGFFSLTAPGPRHSSEPGGSHSGRRSWSWSRPRLPVEFSSGPSTAPTDARHARCTFRPRGELTAAIATTRLFISADTDMHLASATPVPTIALFRASDPILYALEESAIS